jgi:limonene-1,2-epoxide hydrolase
MSSAIDTVNAFLAECARSKEAMHAAFRSYFNPTTIWENVGMMSTTGAEEALALMGNFEAQLGLATMKVDMVAIAAQGNKVLTERVDHMVKPDGGVAMSVRVCGIFEVEGGKITAWRDYFDTAGMMGGGQGS